MSLIIAENLAHAYGDHVVVKSASFRIAQADRIGLVGANGEGKTTLLRIIEGSLEPTGGEVHRKRGLRIGYLPQDPPALHGTTVHGAMLDVFADVRRMERELHALAARIDNDPPGLKRYGELQHEFEQSGGYGYLTRIEQVLTGLAFGRELWDRPLSQLSGGQRTRAYLATLLLRSPDVLLLDEPTNHLDIESCEWVEFWLQSFRGALVVVSHDRYLLDRVTKSTWEIAFTNLETYRGPYSKFRTLRAERHKERLRTWEAQQEFIAKTQEFIRIHMGSQRTNEAKGRRTRLERFLRDEAVEQPREQQAIHLALPAGRRTGDIVLRADALVVGYERSAPLLTIPRIEVERGWRIAVVGPNGAGKTTLLRTLLGELDPLEGTVRRGANVVFGYLSQTLAELDPDSTAVDAVRSANRDCKPERARSLLGGLLLSGEDADKRVADLSGGQRSRVALARLVVVGANVLLLDEPTNHLDIPSMEAVQSALQRFDGTIVFVSHDRYLIQAIATHVWAIDGGQVCPMSGRWDKYLEWRAERTARQRTTTATAYAHHKPDGTIPAMPHTKAEREAIFRDARKQANALKRLKHRHAQLEHEIEAVERELVGLNRGITVAAADGATESLLALSREHQERTAHLKRLWDEWERIGEQIED